MARIIRLMTVVRDGMSNAFTDLQYWQGNYWVAYRKGAGHVSMDGEMVVSVSAERETFREVARLKMPGDCRDPKLLPVGEDRMALYFPSWTEGHSSRRLQQYISFSTNGYTWEHPRPVLESGLWLWRIRRHEGRYYGLVQNVRGDWSGGNVPLELDLIVSEDLLSWDTIARIGDGQGLCESDIHFRPDGEAWVVARTSKQTEEVASYFAYARPPYEKWETVGMPQMVHAPVFVEHEGALYVAGRSNPAREKLSTFPFPSSTMGVWRVRRGELEPVLWIPASGDCSYPGFIEDPEGRVCLSYYSQHAYHMGVVEEPTSVALNERCRASDVYFAELEL
jgi:hypothetical protein